MKLVDKILALKQYFFEGVWKEPHNTTKVRIVKTLNLSVTAFMDRGLQSKSMSLTYSTVLAIVPALALMFAIARGFGLQNNIQDALLQQFPSQTHAIDTGMKFVDSYLSQASQGLFVGIGIIFLLWTLISVLSTVEDVFNNIWDIKQSRSMYQKITDYIAICLIVPVLMVCSSGITLFMSTMVKGDTPLAILTPVVDIVLDISPVILAWLAITVSYFLIPNTKVNFKYAAIAGAFATIGFEAVQYLLMSGQIYVSKYNAIYGSFAFLPLMLIWLQLSWLIMLSGCVLTHAMQNIYGYNYLGDVSNVSHRYIRQISLAMMAIITQRFDRGEPPLTRNEISTMYNLPVSILSRIIDRLHSASLVYYVNLEKDQTGLVPAVDNDKFTVGMFFDKIDTMGESGFIPYFNSIFAKMLRIIRPVGSIDESAALSMLIRDLPVPTPAQVQKIINTPGLSPYPETGVTTHKPEPEGEEIPIHPVAKK